MQSNTLRPDSHWLVPAFLLAVGWLGAVQYAVASGDYRPCPRTLGTAIGLFNAIFGLGQMLGISLSGIFLMAFQYYSGRPENPQPSLTRRSLSLR
jgi:hypothetical protein